MKKLLSAALALAIGATCTVGLVGCTDKAEVAQKGANTLKVLYDKTSLYETNGNFEVLGEVVVDDKEYSVKWEVTAENNNISDYIKFGDMDADTKMITASVTKPEEAIEYTLTATVKVGKKSATASFKRKLLAKAKSHAGTKEDPYTAANVIEIAYTMTPKTKLEESDNPQRVYVQGYIVDCGSDSGSRAGYVYIVDEYSADKTKSSADAVMILSINYDSVNLTGFADLKKGAKIMVSGYIMLYQKNESSDPQPEVTYYGSEGVLCEYLEKAERSDKDKVEAAYNSVDLSKKLFNATGEIDLPATNNGATLSWAVKGTSEYVKVEGGKLKVTSIPDSKVEVTLTVTITSGSESKTKDITIKLLPPGATEHAGTEADPLSLSDVESLFATLDKGKTYQEDNADKEFYIKGYITDVGGVSQYGFTRVYIADDADTKKDDSVLVYSINYSNAAPQGTELEEGDLITLTGYILNHSSGGYEIGQSGTGNTAKYPSITKLEKPVLTDAQKVEKALKKLPASFPVTKTGLTPLPESTVSGVTFTWSYTGSDYTVQDGKINVAALPATDDTITVKLVASCGDATVNKDFTVVIKAPLPAGSTVKFDFTGLKAPAAGDFNAIAVDAIKACTTGEVTVEVPSGSFYSGNNSGSGDVQGDGVLRAGSGKTGAQLKLTFGSAVSKVEIKCQAWNSSDNSNLTPKGKDTVSVNGSTAQTPNVGSATVLTFELASTSDVVTIDVKNRCFVFEIVVYFA